MRYPTLLTCISLLLCGCYADDLERDMRREPFYDLAGYMQTQIDSLQEAGVMATKTITLNGQRESKRLDDIDYATDLRVFRDADINKPAWLDKFEEEKRELDGGRISRVYSATDSSMQTRRLTIVTKNERPVQIDVLRRTGTVLSDGTHRLRYLPGRGYRIRTVQENRFVRDIDALIEVTLE